MGSRRLLAPVPSMTWRAMATQGVEGVGVEWFACTAVAGVAEPFVDQPFEGLVDEGEVAAGAGGLEMLGAFGVAPASYPAPGVDAGFDLLQVLAFGFAGRGGAAQLTQRRPGRLVHQVLLGVGVDCDRVGHRACLFG